MRSFKYVLTKNVCVNQGFGHTWFRQLCSLKVFWGLLLCPTCFEMLCEWAGVSDFESPWDRIL